jgi:hypothetical protein
MAKPKPVKKEPAINRIEKLEKIGKSTRSFFSFSTLKLLMAIFQPFDKRSRKPIVR